MIGTGVSSPREPLTVRGCAQLHAGYLGRWGKTFAEVEHSIQQLSHSRTLKSPGSERRGSCIPSLRTVEPTLSLEWLPKASLGVTQASCRAGIRRGTAPVILIPFSGEHPQKASPPMISPSIQVVAITTLRISTLALIRFTMSIPPAELRMLSRQGSTAERERRVPARGGHQKRR